MRVCIAYDCLYPWTVGGAERWYRDLAEALAAAGHDVTYLTLRQWPRGEPARLAGVEVAVVGPQMALYTRAGRRRVLPPLAFGLGVLTHLARHGREYDVVHLASFPYFSLLAASALRRRGRFRLVVDWFEVWSDAYWCTYLGRAGGRAGSLVQRACARTSHRAFAFSRLHADRLSSLGHRGEVRVLEGLLRATEAVPSPEPPEPLVVFAGRLIPEKRAEALVPAVVEAAKELPGVRGVIYGDGPRRSAVEAAVTASGGLVRAPGFVAGEEIAHAFGRALCLLLPSEREGYGLVVAEAAAAGTPVVVAAGPDNAAVELVVDGVNGVVAASASPEDLGAAIVRVARAGEAMRRSTREWFAANAQRLSLERSVETVLAEYAR